MAEVAVTVAILLVERVHHVISQEADLKENVVLQAERIKTLLSTLRAYLQVHDGRLSQNEIQANKAVQIRGIVHQIEDALDGFMYQSPHNVHKHKVSKKIHKCSKKIHKCVQSVIGGDPLHELSSKISEISVHVRELHGWHEFTSNLYSTPDLGESSSRRNWIDDTFVHFPEENEIIGFQNLTSTLLDQLTREEQNRHTEIYVVGPGGFGKSTLARNAYVHKKVKGHFDCSAWVSVTQRFDETELVDDMISQFQDKITRSMSYGRRDKQSHVRSFLQNKRYLVVLDDVCNEKDLRFLKSFLPKNAVGSRIIITTYKHDMVLSHDGSPTRSHDLSGGLSEEAAWNLFCKKAFFATNGTCPLELVSIAHKILSKCGGSPFAIVSLSRMLAMKAQLPAEWEAFHDSLRSEIGTDPNCIVSKTLLRSYNDLSSTLKSCFLYTSVFPENYRIERGRLIRLWLAEGFVRRTNGKSLERVADDYLDELIARNLIHVTERDFSGKAIICEVKNLVHKFLINKSNDENFITIYSEADAVISSNATTHPRRASFCSGTLDPSLLTLTSVRSSFLFTRIDNSQSKKFFSRFELLKVLDLQGSSLTHFPEEICGLTLLRYLSLRGTHIKTIPNSIKKLVYIETLDLKQTQVRILPKQVLRLPNLRYLLVYLYDVESHLTFDSVKGVKLCPEVRFLSELLKLTLIKANDQAFIEDLGNLTKLRKLGLIDLKTEDGGKLCAAVQKMTQLSTLDVRSESALNILDLHDMQHPPCHLQRLYLKGRLKKIPNWISSLKSLVRIGLIWSKLQVSPIPALQILPNLMELQLLDTYTGEELNFGAGYFIKLKILRIEKVTELTTIVIQEGAMPNIGKLVLSKCKNLMLPPLGINHLALLEELHAYDMNNEFTGALRPTSDHCWMVKHVPVIRSAYFGTNGQWTWNNLS